MKDERAARPHPLVGGADYVLLGVTVALLTLGTLMVYSASFVIAHNEFDDDLYFLVRHVGAIALGGVAMLALARLDYRRWRGLSLLVMLACIALLLLVLVPGIGTRTYGAVRWIRLGPINIQPSELAKLAVALYLADWLARRGKQVQHLGSGSIPFAIIVGIVAALVEMQPDLGTTAVIVGMAAAVFFVGGANLLHVALMAALGVLGGFVAIARMSGYRQDRIAAFLDPWSDLQGSGWHTAQTLISLGSGGPFGVGLGSSLHKFYWVPNAHTDAIFAIIGEELGFVGALSVLALFGLLAWRGFTIAWRAPDTFGRLFAAGLTSGLILQALVNIAVITNSVPYTGVPLPFISYGGSSTVVSMAAVGLLLSISRAQAAPAAARSPSPLAARGSSLRVAETAGLRRRVSALLRGAAMSRAGAAADATRRAAHPEPVDGRATRIEVERSLPGGLVAQARPIRRRALRPAAGGGRGRPRGTPGATRHA